MLLTWFVHCGTVYAVYTPWFMIDRFSFRPAAIVTSSIYFRFRCHVSRGDGRRSPPSRLTVTMIFIDVSWVPARHMLNTLWMNARNPPPHTPPLDFTPFLLPYSHRYYVETTEWFKKWYPCFNSAITDESVALLVARRTNNRKVAGSRPTKVMCITVLTGNRMGVNCPLWPAATPSSESEL